MMLTTVDYGTVTPPHSHSRNYRSLWVANRIVRLPKLLLNKRRLGRLLLDSDYVFREAPEPFQLMVHPLRHLRSSALSMGRLVMVMVRPESASPVAAATAGMWSG